MKGHPVLLVGRNRRSGSHRKHAHIVQCIDPAPPDLQLINMCTAPLVNRLNIKVRQCSVSSLLQGYENQIYEGLVSVICNVIFGTQQKKGLYVCVRRRTLCTLVPYSPPLLLSQKKHIPQGTGIMHVEFRMTAVWKNDLFERGSRRQCVDCQPINRGVITEATHSRG